MIPPKPDEAHIFNEARQIAAPFARRRYLEGACEGDPVLLARLEALLRIHDNDLRFLRQFRSFGA